MKINTILKYLLFLIGDGVVTWFSLGFLTAGFFSIAIGVKDFSIFILFLFYLILRGTIIVAVFRTLRDSVFIYPSIVSFILFAVMLYLGSFYIALTAFAICWVTYFITTFVPWAIYDIFRPKAEKCQVSPIDINQRYPYLETDLELINFEKARTKFDDADADRQIDYAFFKGMTAKNIASREDSFGAACIAESKEIMENLANEGVYYLMHFIALGTLSAENGEGVEFIEMELRHIQQSGKLELLKCRINEHSFALLEEDLQRAIEYYNKAE